MANEQVCKALDNTSCLSLGLYGCSTWPCAYWMCGMCVVMCDMFKTQGGAGFVGVQWRRPLLLLTKASSRSGQIICSAYIRICILLQLKVGVVGCFSVTTVCHNLGSDF